MLDTNTNEWLSRLSNFELIGLLFLMACVFFAINKKIKEKEEAEAKNKDRQNKEQ